MFPKDEAWATAGAHVDQYCAPGFTFAMNATHEPLKALSIRQPWAELILRGDKTAEYRSQPTKVRGRVYIYAPLASADLDDAETARLLGPPAVDLLRGVTVGTVEIVDCVGSDGEYEWCLANPERLDPPLAPSEQPQPVWFHPFGRPEDAYEDPADAKPAATTDDAAFEVTPSATRFSPVIEAASKPPFTPYHAKYLAYGEGTKGSGVFFVNQRGFC